MFFFIFVFIYCHINRTENEVRVLNYVFFPPCIKRDNDVSLRIGRWEKGLSQSRPYLKIFHMLSLIELLLLFFVLFPNFGFFKISDHNTLYLLKIKVFHFLDPKKALNGDTI